MAYTPDDLTDKELEALEKRIAEVFKEAEKDLDKEVKEYFAKFKLRDKEMQALVDAGEMTKADYQQWRLTQMGRGQRFEALRDKVAERYTQANEVANAYVNDMTPSIYSLNRNYEAYTIEKAVGSCDFTMWDESTVRRLLVEQPDLMPYYPPSRALNRGIDLAYGKDQITKHVTSGIIRGLAPGKIANELMTGITTMNRDSAVRAARTGITAAQNGGRMDSYIAAEKMGIQIKRRWVCTKDARTRLDHGLADGQIVVGTKKPFVVGGYKMMFPGDKSLGAPGHEIYSCRCTTRTVEKDGIEAEPRQMRVRNAEGEWELVNEMTYSEWQNWKNGLENSVKSGTIETGSVLDNFDRKIRLTEHTEDLLKTNPNYGTREYKWRNNCQRCVPTYEMRRRGLKVTAKPIPTTVDKDYLAGNYAAAWENQERVWCMSGNGLEQIKAQMAAWGDGARAEVSIAWNDTGIGHVFVAEQRNGATVFLDPQSGDTDCSRYFKNAKKGLTNILRIDNNTPSNAILDCCDNGGE